MQFGKSQMTVVYRKRATDPAENKAHAQHVGHEGFAGRLRFLREKAGLSLREQDKYAGMTLNHSHAIDQGRKDKGVESRVLARLARMYGCTMDWLFLGLGSPPTDRAINEAVDIAAANYHDVDVEQKAIRDRLRKL